MSDLGLPRPGPQRIVTWRALLAGAVCSAFVSILAPYGAFRLQTSTMALDFSVPAAVFTMFLLALVVMLARAITGRSILSRNEMLVAYGMMAVACAICTMGLVGQLLPMIGAITYYASPDNKWGEYLIPYMKPWLFLPRTGEGALACKYMFEGLPANLTAAQLNDIAIALARPLLAWGVFIFALYATSICLMAIFRKQWVEDERIQFPLVQLPMELASQPQAQGERVPPFFKSPFLWIGFAVPFLLAAINGLASYYQVLQDVRPTLSWQVKALDGTWPVQFRISWQTLGLAYLLSADVSLCVWSLGLLGSFYKGVSSFIGFKSLEKLSGYGASTAPDLGHFGMGAMIALVLLRLWIGRRRIVEVLRKAVLLDRAVDDSREPMSYFAAFWGAVLGALVMLVWLILSGLSPLIALLILFAAFIGFIGLTRIIAESGVPVSIVPLISSDFVISGVGTSSLSRETMAAMPWTYVWNSDVRTFVMCSAAHGMRAVSPEAKDAAKRPTSTRGLFWAMMLAAVIAFGAASGITLYFMFDNGAVNLHNWFFVAGPQRPFAVITSLIREQPRAPDLRGWAATGVGAAVMCLFTAARHRFVWWPLNPIGLPIAVVSWTHVLWFSIFLSWLIKNRILKYGGPKLYLKLRPLFLGLVLGEYSAAAFWILIDGLNNNLRNAIFWI